VVEEIKIQTIKIMMATILSKKIIIYVGEEIRNMAEEERILIKGRCSFIIVTGLAITLMSADRATIQTRKVRMKKHTWCKMMKVLIQNMFYLW